MLTAKNRDQLRNPTLGSGVCASCTVIVSPAWLQVGLSVYLRVSQYSRADSISGVRCFLGVAGQVRLELRRIPGAAAESRSVLPGTALCMAFQLVDRGVAGISATVVRPRSCDHATSAALVDFQTELSLPLADVMTDRSLVAIRHSGVGVTAIDQFSISTHQPHGHSVMAVDSVP